MNDTHRVKDQFKTVYLINTRDLDCHETRVLSYEAISLQIPAYKDLKWSEIEQA